MGLLKNLFGRSEPPKANLDNLFAVPSAAITLEASSGFTSTGEAAVCYRQAEGGAFAAAQTDVQALLDADGGPKVRRTTDDFGFTWLMCRADPSQVSELVTDVHAVNSALENAGFGPSLLCSLVVFSSADGKRFALVYLYKQGTFYPFAPTGKNQRDNALELQVRGVLADDLRIEPELGRWMALWGAPGL
ncbi:MAG: PspA-associated protein PspAB [Nocardioidaceae bacterium]